MIRRVIIILANSIKNNGRCLAGKDVFSGEWIRIVGDENGRELRIEDGIKYKNVHGSYGLQNVHVLQRIEVFLKKKVYAFNYQPENWLYNDNCIWIQQFKIARENLDYYVDNPPDLWMFDNPDFEIDLESIDYNDRVSFEFLKNFPYYLSSLYLIKVDKVKIYKRESQSMRRRAVFQYKGVWYNLALTDPFFKDCKDIELEDKYLCVSLGEPFLKDNSSKIFCYKIVAAVI